MRAIVNRYLGNTGRVEKRPDKAVPREAGASRPSAAPPKTPQSAYGSAQVRRADGMMRPKQPAGVPRGKKPGGLLDGLASRLDLSRLETEDLLLLLILYLLYRESGDEELLIMMGAMFLL